MKPATNHQTAKVEAASLKSLQALWHTCLLEGLAKQRAFGACGGAGGSLQTLGALRLTAHPLLLVLNPSLCTLSFCVGDFLVPARTLLPGETVFSDSPCLESAEASVPSASPAKQNFWQKCT